MPVAVASALNPLLVNARDSAGTWAALIASLQRAEGADTHGDAHWKKAQSAAAAASALSAAKLLDAAPRLRAGLATALRRSGIRFSLPARGVDAVEKTLATKRTAEGHHRLAEAARSSTGRHRRCAQRHRPHDRNVSPKLRTHRAGILDRRKTGGGGQVACPLAPRARLAARASVARRGSISFLSNRQVLLETPAMTCLEERLLQGFQKQLVAPMRPKPRAGTIK